MKRIDAGKTMTLVAIVGAIGGILLLAYELRQNNELMAAEARQVRTSIVPPVYSSGLILLPFCRLVG